LSGISAGSINAGVVSLFEIGQEKLMAEFIIAMTLNITTKNVYKEWPEGILYGLLHKSGIFDNSPLLDMSNAILSKFTSIKRRFAMGTDDSVDGEYVIMTEKNIPFEDTSLAIVSSASIPGFFPDR